MKIIKLSEEHYVGVDDSEIKEGDWIGFPNLKKFVPVQYLGGDLTGYEKRITHSTQPFEDVGLNTSMGCQLGFDKIEPLYLSEVKELIGEVDVEKKADEEYYEQDKSFENDIDPFLNYSEYLKVGFIDGYNQALEDNKEKKYTDEDLRKAIITTRQRVQAVGSVDVEGVIQSLQPKTEWKVEIIDGKLTLK